MISRFAAIAILAPFLSAPLGAEADEMRIALLGLPIDCPDHCIVIDARDTGAAGEGVHRFYIWDNSFDITAGSDPQYGDFEKWSITASDFWGGALYIPASGEGAEPLDLSRAGDGWVFHFRFMTSGVTSPFRISTGPYIPGKYDGNGNPLQPGFDIAATDYPFNGEWQEVAIPLNHILGQYNTPAEGKALLINSPWSDINAFSITGSSGWKGRTIALCDMWIGGPIESNFCESAVSAGGITEYYSCDGIRLATPPQKGIFIIRKTAPDGKIKTSKAIR